MSPDMGDVKMWKTRSEGRGLVEAVTTRQKLSGGEGAGPTDVGRGAPQERGAGACQGHWGGHRTPAPRRAGHTLPWGSEQQVSSGHHCGEGPCGPCPVLCTGCPSYVFVALGFTCFFFQHVLKKKWFQEASGAV